MEFIWSYSVHAIFTLLLFPLAIEVIAVASSPVIDLGMLFIRHDRQQYHQ